MMPAKIIGLRLLSVLRSPFLGVFALFGSVFLVPLALRCEIPVRIFLPPVPRRDTGQLPILFLPGPDASLRTQLAL